MTTIDELAEQIRFDQGILLARLTMLEIREALTELLVGEMRKPVEFQVGDRVRYESGDNNLNGWVTGVTSYGVFVSFDIDWNRAHSEWFSLHARQYRIRKVNKENE